MWAPALRGGNLCWSCYWVAWPVAQGCAVPANEEKLIGSDVTREKGKVTHDKRGQFSEGRLVICGQLLSALKGLQSTFSASGIQKIGKITTWHVREHSKCLWQGMRTLEGDWGNQLSVTRGPINPLCYCRCSQEQWDMIWHNRTWCKTMRYSIIQ